LAGVNFAKRVDGTVAGTKEIGSFPFAAIGIAAHRRAVQNLDSRTMLSCCSACVPYHATILRRTKFGPGKTVFRNCYRQATVQQHRWVSGELALA
jgi:hypothetical protein